jgi:hypothetical protein
LFDKPSVSRRRISCWLSLSRGRGRLTGIHPEGSRYAFSAVLLGVFGVTFAGSVQAGFEKVWGLPAGPWHKIWRQAVWLAALIAYIYAAATAGAATRHAPAVTVSRVLVAVLLGVVFFWWGLRFLAGGRVSYLAALPGAVATVAFLAGLRAFGVRHVPDKNGEMDSTIIPAVGDMQLSA